jgi:hypothetical protein
MRNHISRGSEHFEYDYVMFQLNSDLMLCLKMEDFPKSDEREFLAKANVLLEDPDVSISVSSSHSP